MRTRRFSSASLSSASCSSGSLQDEARAELAFEAGMRRLLYDGYQTGEAVALADVLERVRALSQRVFRRDVVGQPSVFAFRREAPAGSILCMFNFSESWTSIGAEWIHAQGVRDFHDSLSDGQVSVEHGRVAMPPYGRVWLR